MMQRHQNKLKWLEITLAFIAALAGAAFAIVCLVFKPVAISNASNPAATAPDDAHVVRYVQGSRDRAKGATWVRKRSALLTATPGVITLNEDELNTWFAASSHTRSARRAGVSASATQLDFHIARNLLQVAAPLAVQTPLGVRTVIVQTRGGFERLPADPVTGMPSVIMYVPREAFAGSLPLHRLPGAVSSLMDELLQSQTPPAEALAAWRKIERVSVGEHDLSISISNTHE